MKITKHATACKSNLAGFVAVQHKHNEKVGKMIRRKSNNRIGIAHIFWFYWTVLVAWQNLSAQAARSGGDLVLKIGLIAMLTAFYFSGARKVSVNIVTICLFALTMLCSWLLSGDSISANNLIAYSYPILLVLLSFGIGNDFQINQKELFFFLNGVILVTLYAALYAIFFQTEYFRMALSRNTAYGHELTSFFISNHEYGLYLVCAIAACLICIETNRQASIQKNLWYVAAIAVFLPNLILTFSRNSLVTLAIVSIAYLTVGKYRQLRRWAIAAMISAAIALLISEPLRNFLTLLLFKGQEGLGSRSALYQFAIDTFAEGNTIQKVFGRGIRVRTLFETALGHGSVHNAYLQVLLYFGLLGIAFLLVFFFSQLRANLRLYHYAKFYSVMFTAFLLAAAIMMLTHTAIIFTSPIDSFFLTVFVILVPKYVRNAICAGTFN